MEEHTALITETETLMSDGSTNVHCEAMHDGQRIGAAYIVPPVVSLPDGSPGFVHLGNGSYEQREERRARHRAVAHRAIVDKINALRVVIPEQTDEARAARGVLEGVKVSFNPYTCDPTGEGEELAKAITDAVHENDSGAIGTLLQAAVCLGAEILEMDDDDETLAAKIFENDTWRERLKTAISTAETWIVEVDSSKPTE